MRAKTVLWAAPLALFVAGGCSENCFSQSNFRPVPSDVQMPAAAANPNPFAVAAALPNSKDQSDFQTDIAEGNMSENAGREESNSKPKRPGRVSASKVGIGVKFS